MPLAAQRTVFDKLERVVAKPDENTPKVSGFGLGLNYVMNVARAHGGYVSVESKEGKYSEFTVSLPLPPEELLLSE
ncbi:MAG: ATP-binding protein [Bacteroides sp.]|nr:ATP-binding protein [Bacteroides sp.]